jgi:hypothetical protein
MTSIFRKNNFTTSQDVYVNCLRRHSTSIVNKDLVKTQQSNAMRIAQKLASTNLGGTTTFAQTVDNNNNNNTNNNTSNNTTNTTNNNNTTNNLITRCTSIQNKNKF